MSPVQRIPRVAVVGAGAFGRNHLRVYHELESLYPGELELTGTMQAITTVVERWVREYPEQWLWLHRRWR